MKALFDGIAEGFIVVLFIVSWLMGVVLAKGFWMTIFALFPPYAWYLVVERAMQLNGWI